MVGPNPFVGLSRNVTDAIIGLYVTREAGERIPARAVHGESDAGGRVVLSFCQYAMPSATASNIAMRGCSDCHGRRFGGNFR